MTRIVKATQETLQEAKEHLESTALVGVVEAYEDSMLLFEAALERGGLEADLAYVPQNTSRDDHGVSLSFAQKLEQVRSALGPLYESVLECNGLDLALYEHAQTLLERRLAEYVVDPEAARKVMKRRCKVLLGQQRRRRERPTRTASLGGPGADRAFRNHAFVQRFPDCLRGYGPASLDGSPLAPHGRQALDRVTLRAPYRCAPAFPRKPE
jgi:hypothetical protein